MLLRSLIVAGLAGLTMIYACKPEDKGTTDLPVPVKYDPTPYPIAYPGWVNIYASVMPVPAANPTTREGVQLGRKLFYDKRLSDDLTMSCASCHKIENAFSDPRKFSAGTNGALGHLNAMAIINLAWANHFFWDGRRNTLEEQAHDPVTNMIEMRNTWPTVVTRLQADANYPALFFKAFGTTRIDSNLVAKAIAQFERTLVSFNSRFDKYYFENDTTALNNQEKRGLDLFFGRADCDHCHGSALLAENAFRNNGLDDVFTDIGYGKVTGKSTDNGKFKVTSLRNIAQTAPYMHDSRFATLEEVINHYDHGIKPNSPNLESNIDGIKFGINLTVQEKADLLAFLKTFTDSSFITNPEFKEPK